MPRLNLRNGTMPQLLLTRPSTHGLRDVIVMLVLIDDDVPIPVRDLTLYQTSSEASQSAQAPKT